MSAECVKPVRHPIAFESSDQNVRTTERRLRNAEQPARTSVAHIGGGFIDRSLREIHTGRASKSTAPLPSFPENRMTKSRYAASTAIVLALVASACSSDNGSNGTTSTGGFGGLAGYPAAGGASV